MLKRFLLPVLLCALVAAAPAPAAGTPQAASAPGAPTDSLRAFLLTFGPGAAVWERFGHNALWIHDPGTGSDRAYHYGLFDMSEEGFLLEFLKGRMLYSMGTAPAEWIVEAYRRNGRDVFVQELRLGQDRIRELQQFLEWNMRPENRVYRYDYFRDNCSTRIRDAIDRALDGALREELGSRPSPLTYREQAVALTAEDRLLTTGMDLGLGPLADQPITRWDLAFIPMRLRDDLRGVTVEREGETVPLVAAERELPAVGREDDPAGVPAHETSTRGRALGLLLTGLLIGGVLAGAGHLTSGRQSGGPGGTPGGGGRRDALRPVARWTLVAGGAAWGLVTGVLGLILLALWILTDHEFAWRNENLLQATPLALGLVPLVPLAVLRSRYRRAARTLALMLVALSLVGLVLHFLPVTRQGNLPIIGLSLPVHIGLAWALHRTRERG